MLDGLSSDGVIAKRLGEDGAIAKRLDDVVSGLSSVGNISTRLKSYLVTGAAGSLSSIASDLPSFLGASGPLASRLDSVVSGLASDGSIAKRLDDVVSGLSSVGNISTRLKSYLVTSDDVTAATLLSRILTSLSGTGVLSSQLGSVIDGLETGSTSIVSQLAQLPGILSSGFSSVVSGLGDIAIDIPSSITAVLSPDATIEADVAGEAAQSASLWDSIVGDVDTDEIRSQMDACVGYLRTSFPFGLIFVVVDTLGALSASPVAPVFEADVPAVVGTYHMELDLSFFDPVASLFRGGFVVLYVFGLYSVTKQWVFNAGGDSA